MTSQHTAPILLADVGGTNARFAIACLGEETPLRSESIRRYRVADFPTLGDAAAQYLKEIDAQAERAVFAIAGRIEEGVVKATNNPWHIVADEVRQHLGMQSVHLVNDFGAMSMAMPLLEREHMQVIGSPGVPALGARHSQNFAIVGPGTGLGVGGLIYRNGLFHRLETEGGHSGFAPRSAEEIEVLQRVAARFGHVSNERLISGLGMVNLHRALVEIAGRDDADLSPEQITARADSGEDAVCVRTVELFCTILGAVAGDIALVMGAWDGVFLTGGLPPLLLPWLRKGSFRERFEAKGRLGEAVSKIPTVVVTHPDVGLLGTAGVALNDAGIPLLERAG